MLKEKIIVIHIFMPVNMEIIFMNLVQNNSKCQVMQSVNLLFMDILSFRNTLSQIFHYGFKKL